MSTLLIAAALLGAWIEPSLAQDSRSGDAFGTSGPRFLTAAGQGNAAGEPVWRDAAREAVFQQRIALELDGTSLDHALAEVARKGGFKLTYSSAVVRLDSPVALNASNITVGAALSALLYDAGVDVLLTSRGHAALVRRVEPPARHDWEPGSIIGQVTEGETGDPVINAQIAVDGRGRVLTGNDGRYRIDGVEPGRRTVSVTSIGYASTSREVEIGDGATVTVDFALEVSATPLDAVVVTVTGEQRLRELGHAVGRIHADSVVREAPVASVSELLAGRVPGLHVFNHSGMVGGRVSLQIRSPNSLLLETEPIVIVDGIRYTSGESGGGAALSFEPTSRLNDLNPNDIETIEVVKAFGRDALRHRRGQWRDRDHHKARQLRASQVERLRTGQHD